MKNKNVEDLRRELAVKRGKLREFRFAVIQSKAKNVKSGNVLRRDIARILTRINQLTS